MVTRPIVETKHLYFHYNNRLILEDVSFQVFPADFVAIIGPNGGGKSTFLKLIVGLLKPSSGSIQIFGKTPIEARPKIGYLAQRSDAERHFPISALEVVALACCVQGPFTTLNRKVIERAEEAMSRTNTQAFRNRPFSDLSGGEQQRILLARALVNQPDLLILDEPTTGIDQDSEKCFYELLAELNNTIAILFISHDISAVAQNAKKVACLNKRMVFHGTKELLPEDIKNSYCCHVDLIAHGAPHRVLKTHDNA